MNEDWRNEIITKGTAYDALANLDQYAEVCECLEAIKGLPSAQPEQRWIPVSERLPEEDKEVLVSVYFAGLKQTHKNGWKDDLPPSYYVDIARCYCGEWSSATDEYKIASNRHKVIAWMPLPEAFKGGQG